MKSKKYIIIMFIIISIVMTLASPAFAKYITGGTSEVGITADKFYFTVDLLGDTNDDASLSKSYNLYGGDTKTLTFNIQNYFDDLRITKADITYNVSLEVNNPTGSNYNKNLVTLTRTGNNTLSKNVKSNDTCTLTVPTGYANLTTVVVTVSSTVPYTKTMVITFVFHSYEFEVAYYIIDSENSLYAELIVISNIEIGALELLIDFSLVNQSSNVLQVDMTNTYLLDKEEINGEIVLTQKTNKIPDGEEWYKQVYNTIHISSGEAISIKFFKSNISKNYSKSVTNIEKESSIYKVVIPQV